MAHTTYSPKDVNVTWNGYSITGFGEDSFIRLEWDEDVFMKHVGADGVLALTKNADLTGTIELELMATANSNAVLGAIEKAQRADTAGKTVALSNFTISDPSGSALAYGINAYIMGRPSIDLGSDQNTKVWTFGCETLEFVEVPEDLAGEVDGIVDALNFSL